MRRLSLIFSICINRFLSQFGLSLSRPVFNNSPFHFYAGLPLSNRRRQFNNYYYRTHRIFPFKFPSFPPKFPMFPSFLTLRPKESAKMPISPHRSRMRNLTQKKFDPLFTARQIFFHLDLNNPIADWVPKLCAVCPVSLCFIFMLFFM